MADVLETAEALRREGTELLEARGLRRLLERYGTPHPVGSYALDLMVWRDLDITLEAPSITVEEFYFLGGALAELLQAPRVHYRNERITRSADLPVGLY